MASNKGLSLEEQGLYNEAIQAYDNATRLKPEYAEAWYNKGRAFFVGLKKYDNAIRAYDKAININSKIKDNHKLEIAEAWHNYSKTLADQCKCEEANNAHIEAILLNPAYEQADGSWTITWVVCKVTGFIKGLPLVGNIFEGGKK